MAHGLGSVRLTYFGYGGSGGGDEARRVVVRGVVRLRGGIVYGWGWWLGRMVGDKL